MIRASTISPDASSCGTHDPRQQPTLDRRRHLDPLPDDDDVGFGGFGDLAVTVPEDHCVCVGPQRAGALVDLPPRRLVIQEHALAIDRIHRQRQTYDVGQRTEVGGFAQYAAVRLRAAPGPSPGRGDPRPPFDQLAHFDRFAGEAETLRRAARSAAGVRRAARSLAPGSTGSSRAAGTDARRIDHVRRACVGPDAPSIRALSRHSSYSSASTESQTTPLPTPNSALAGAAVDHHRPDRHVEVRAPTRRDVADRPGVDPARRRLQLADDPHRAVLRRAGDRPAREHRLEQPVQRSRLARPPPTVEVICHCSGYRSTSNSDVALDRLPVAAMRPRSLRTMSTIITFSARFFADWRSASAVRRILRRPVAARPACPSSAGRPAADLRG